MPELMVLKCPVCGAPLSPGDTHCSFCGSAIFIKADVPTLNLKHLNQTVIQEHIADFRARIRKDRYDVEAHYGLGMAYYNLGLGDEAIEELTNAAKLMPENADIQTQLAVVLYRAVEAGKASAEQPMKERLAKALTLDPTNVEAIILRADIVRRRGDYAQALRILEPVIQRDPQRVNARRAELLERLGRQALSSGNTTGFERIIAELRQIGDDARVRELLQLSIQMHRDDLGPTVTIGPGGQDARMAEDLSDKAVSWLKTVLVGVGSLVVGFIVIMIFAVAAPKGADGSLSGGATLAFGLLFLAWIVSPFFGGWLYRRQMRKPRSAWDDRLGRRISRDDILGGQLSTEDLIAVEQLLSSGGVRVAVG